MHQTTPSYPASPTHRFRPNDEYDHCLTRLSNLNPSNISWLWPSRLPLAQISLLVARPGLGKSLLTADLAARISTASPWPDGSPSSPGSVLFICGEDDPAQVLRPRLLACGADLTKIHHLNAAQYRRDAVYPEVLFNLNHHQLIHNALEHLPDCKLVVIDSIGALLGSTGSNSSITIHSLFAPLAHMANRFGPAFLLVAHTRKQQTTCADELVLGSRAFTSIPHNIWHIMRDPKNPSRRLLLSGKSNLAAEAPGLAFTISQNSPKILWEKDPLPMNADEALATKVHQVKGPAPAERKSAEHWLTKLLEAGPVEAQKIREEANNAGLIFRTVQRAADYLNIERERGPNPGQWFWRLPNKV